MLFGIVFYIKNNKLCEMIENVPLTIEEWKKQKEVQNNKEKASLLELGFSTLFLNRTNRSGIIRAGVMGGQEQTGNYLMDCRFNKENLIERIQKIASRKKDITLYNLDAIKLIDTIEKEANKNTIFYFDPPYYLKGNTLYMNHYQSYNHQEVSDRIKQVKNIQWVVSYDNVPEIQSLYEEFSKKEYSFKHTAYQSREGQEILFFSDKLTTPDMKDYDPTKFKLKDKVIIYKESA